MRRLKKNWTRLHRLVDLAGPLATIHYAWAQKADIRIPIAVGILILILLGLRIGPVRAWASQLRFLPRTLRNRFMSRKTERVDVAM